MINSIKIIFILLAVTILHIIPECRVSAAGRDAVLFRETTVIVISKTRGPESALDEGGSGARDMSIVGSGVRYRVLSGVSVLDQEGRTISMDKLPVPCEAFIRYQPMRKGDPDVIKIRVKRLLPHAGPAWSAPAPE